MPTISAPSLRTPFPEPAAPTAIAGEKPIKSPTGVNAAAGAALSVATTGFSATAAETAFHMASNGITFGGALQTVTSGFVNARAYYAGEISARTALTNVAADAGIAGGASAIGAVVGSAIGGTALPVVGIQIGMVIGAGVGFVVDRVTHAIVDPYLNRV